MNKKYTLYTVLPLILFVLWAGKTGLEQHTEDDFPTTTITIEHSESVLGITPQADGALCIFYPDLFSEMNPQEILTETAPIPTGLGWGMGKKDLSTAVQLGRQTYRVEPDISLSGKLHLYSGKGNEQEIKMRYILLLNEHQIAAFDHEPQIYQELTLLPNEYTTLEFALLPLSNGVHEAILIGIVQEEMSPDGFVNSFNYRLTLIAGEYQAASQTYHLLEPSATKSGDESFFNLNVHADESRIDWGHPNPYREVDETIKFYASLGYMESKANLQKHSITPRNSPFALVAFLDGEQVPIQDDSLVFYGALTPDTLYSLLPISLDSSDQLGKRELIIVRINYPRIPMCWTRQDMVVPGGVYFDDLVYVKRVGVDVK